MAWRNKGTWLKSMIVLGLVESGCQTSSQPAMHELPAPRLGRAASPAPTENVIETMAAREVAAEDEQATQDESSDLPLPFPAEANIDLVHALELGGIANPLINVAREAVQEAEAQRVAADALKLPTLNTGVNFNLHRGELQRSSGQIIDSDRQSMFFGGGAHSLAARSASFPGIRFYLPLADIISEPKVARQRLVSRNANVHTVENNTLLDVATAYIDLMRADALLVEYRKSEADFDEIVRKTEAYAKTGQGREADANRAKSNAQLLKAQIEPVIADRIAASARLAAILNLDPVVRLTLPAVPLSALTMIDEKTSQEELIVLAEASRPEMLAGTSDIAEAQLRVGQEKMRPFLPTVMIGYSFGGYGGGGNNLPTSSFGNFGFLNEFDVLAVWNIQNLGFGPASLVKRNQAIVRQKEEYFYGIRNRIRAEVADAQAQVVAAWIRIQTARSQMTTAEDGYRAEMARIQQGIGLPLEILDSTRQLLETRIELVRAIADYNVSQFQLLTAVGTTPGSVPITAGR